MLKSVWQKVLSFLAISTLLSIFGCSNEISDKTSLILLNELQKANVSSSVKYGSLEVSTVSDSRALDVSELTSASVTVSGYGMSDISETATITAGAGSATVSGIPIGTNRVVSVASNVDGVLIRALVDITSGTNSVSVNWEETPVASIFYYLIKDGVDVSEIATDTFDSYIPSVHPALVDAEAIADDYQSGTLSSADSYILSYGTVSVSTSNVSGYKVQVTDITSEKTSITSDSQDFDLVAYPGTWSVRVLDSSDTLVKSASITVVAGETSTVTVGYTEAGDYDYTDKVIAFVKADSAPDIWAWESSGESVAFSEELGGNWGTSSSATLMTQVSSVYMSETDGWYMMDYTSLSSGGNIKFILNWGSTIDSGSTGTFWYDGSSCSSTNPSPASNEAEVSLSVNSAEEPGESVKIYVSASSAPSIWVWQADGSECTSLMGYTWNSQPTMESATDLIYGDGWYVFTIGSDYYTEGKVFSFILNSGSTIASSKSTTFWYDAAGSCGDAGTFYDSDPTTVPDPVEPGITFSKADGSSIPANGKFTVTLDDGYSTITSASVTVSGDTSASYSYSDFTSDVLTVSIADLGLSSGDSISVTAKVTTSDFTSGTTVSISYSIKEEAAYDPFTWDNVNCYFVLTDRFNNAVSANDHSYYRQNADNNDNLNSSYYNVATFHGGDIAGLTAKMDYFNDLGVNAIWITAPYEQAHGWCTGGGNGFPHYAFHGYYTQDWTYMDQNMGTIEEFRTFVNACHANGIRVVMDVVMNHSGYNTVEDMITYNFGHYSAITQSHGWCSNEGDWTANPDSANDSDYWSNDYWDNTWWGCWIRSFGYSSYDEGNDLCGSLSGLPDIRTELEDSVSIPTFLKTKWENESDSTVISSDTGNTLGNKYGDYKNPSVSDVDWYDTTGDWREDQSAAPSDYQVIWLSAWVREFGVDGFRCDTAKHVHMYRWGQLKDACESALAAWRADTSKDKTYNGSDTGAADWDENFWMTGECFGWTDHAGTGDYYSTGKFDSMINFSFNSTATASNSTSYPSTDTWTDYASINSNSDSDGNGNRNNVLTYLSSHDTTLCRPSNAYEMGTMFILTPGGIQIYYGDESSRARAYTGCGDSDMMTRGDMNFGENTDCVAHWGKVGNFRKYNPAVGAGTLVDSSPYKRTYSGENGDNAIAISISSTTVDVSNLFSDGTTVYNWYDGTSTTVSSGNATFSSSSASTSAPVLVSAENPASYGISY